MVKVGVMKVITAIPVMTMMRVMAAMTVITVMTMMTVMTVHAQPAGLRNTDKTLSQLGRCQSQKGKWAWRRLKGTYLDLF